MHLLWIFVWSVVVVTAIVTLIDLFRSRHASALATIGWMLLIIIVPFIGSLIYWLTRKSSRSEVERQYQAEADLRRTRERQSFDPSNPL